MKSNLCFLLCLVLPLLSLNSVVGAQPNSSLSKREELRVEVIKDKTISVHQVWEQLSNFFLQKNSEIQIRQLQWQKSRIRVDVARSQLLPQLNLWRWLSAAVEPGEILLSPQTFVPFLIPANWLKWKETQAAVEVNRWGENIFRMKSLKSFRDLMFFSVTLHNRELLLEAFQSELEKLMGFTDSLDAWGQESPGALLDLKTEWRTLQAERDQVLRLQREVRSLLLLGLGGVVVPSPGDGNFKQDGPALSGDLAKASDQRTHLQGPALDWLVFEGLKIPKDQIQNLESLYQPEKPTGVDVTLDLTRTREWQQALALEKQLKFARDQVRFGFLGSSPFGIRSEDYSESQVGQINSTISNVKRNPSSSLRNPSFLGLEQMTVQEDLGFGLTASWRIAKGEQKKISLYKSYLMRQLETQWKLLKDGEWSLLTELSIQALRVQGTKEFYYGLRNRRQLGEELSIYLDIRALRDWMDAESVWWERALEFYEVRETGRYFLGLPPYDVFP